MCAAVGLLLTGCGSEPAQDLDATVLTGIDAAGRGGGELDLISTTHFDWQKAVIVCPGDDSAEIAEAAGSDAGPVTGDIPSTVDVGTGYIVFVNNNEVAQTATLRLAEADVCTENLSIANRILSPGSATLYVARGRATAGS
ncbi:hypothetical protein NKG05_15370 [Oerskovia sp. M15]